MLGSYDKFDNTIFPMIVEFGLYGVSLRQVVYLEVINSIKYEIVYPYNLLIEAPGYFLEMILTWPDENLVFLDSIFGQRQGGGKYTLFGPVQQVINQLFHLFISDKSATPRDLKTVIYAQPLTITIVDFKDTTKSPSIPGTFGLIRCGQNQAPQYASGFSDVDLHIKDEIVLKFPDPTDDLTKVKYLSYSLAIFNDTSHTEIPKAQYKKWVDF